MYIRVYIPKIIFEKHDGLASEDFQKKSKMLILIYVKIFFQDDPIYFLIFIEVSWYNKRHKYGAPGPQKSRNHGKSRFRCLK